MLWEKINLKTIYKVKFDKEKLINDSKIHINAQLHIGDRVYELKTGLERIPNRKVED